MYTTQTGILTTFECMKSVNSKTNCKCLNIHIILLEFKRFRKLWMKHWMSILHNTSLYWVKLNTIVMCTTNLIRMSVLFVWSHSTLVIKHLLFHFVSTFFTKNVSNNGLKPKFWNWFISAHYVNLIYRSKSLGSKHKKV